jgi:biopolymer transport protein ExbB
MFKLNHKLAAVFAACVIAVVSTVAPRIAAAQTSSGPTAQASTGDSAGAAQMAVSRSTGFSSATSVATTPELMSQAATAPGTPIAPAVQPEVISNPYGLDALWKGGDFVARGTLIILVIMSAASWYVIVTKLFDQFRIKTQAKAANHAFWKKSSVSASIGTLKAGSAYRFIAERGKQSVEHPGSASFEHIDFATWVGTAIQRAVDRVQSRLQTGLSLLATVGSTAPFIGLFGTVWGIYHALTAIGIAGQASIDKVAGPVGEALIMTAIGLAVAVPAVLGYNWLVRRNKTAMEDVRSFGADLHAMLLTGVPPAHVAAPLSVVREVG